VDPLSRRSGHDQLKDVAPKATVSRLRRHLDHLAWLDGIGSATAAWLKGIPAAKIDHFAGEAGALDASEMGDFAVVKRMCWRSACCTGPVSKPAMTWSRCCASG